MREPRVRSPICVRCHQPSVRRLIYGNLCISCANRQFEYIRGRNAKGTVPIKHPPLQVVTMLAESGGILLPFAYYGTGLIEALLAATVQSKFVCRA